MNKIILSFDKQIDTKNVDTMYRNIKKNNEFEFMFFNYKQDKNRMGMENFLKVLEYMSAKSRINKLKLQSSVTLDIIYSKGDGERYRITVFGRESINKYIKMLHTRGNHVIFSVLTGFIGKDPTIKMIQKVKNRQHVIDIDDFDIRVRLSEENEIDKKTLSSLTKISETERNKINFRYKQRVSLIIQDDKNMITSIDLTSVKMNNNINKLEDSIPSYELEIDMTPKSGEPDLKYLKSVYDEITILLKVIQQSNFIISRSLEEEVLDNYYKLLNVDRTNVTSLEGRKPQSLEVQHVVDQLPNKYAVTDKADGERYFLIVYNRSVFLISDLLRVKNMGLLLNDDKFNDTILDGEYIFLPRTNRYIFMTFDCLYSGGRDIRQISSLLERLENADNIIKECFVLKKQKGFQFNNYKGQFDVKKILEHHSGQINEFLANLNHDIEIEKQYPLVRRKYFMGALGAQNNEIFKYAELIWSKFNLSGGGNCPYVLDGLIFHPLDQKYITSVKESKFAEYKWKPPKKNSIDFYIEFEKSKETGKILTLFDNSITMSIEGEEEIRGKPYKIANLYVGKQIKGRETPILFEPETESKKSNAYLFLIDGDVRDEGGNILQDGTVVEFYYNNDVGIPDRHRWVPIRTRYDKTESVQRFGKKYGNYIDISYKIWRSIKNPILIEDMNILSKDESYSRHIEVLRGKIEHSIILSERKENVFNQIRTTIGKPMRNFHNWIKSILIYTHINQTYEIDNKQLSVLDVECGRGGDMMKFYYGKVAFYVGVDSDNNALVSPIDGAISRYNQLRKTHPNFPKMYFINADAKVPFNYEDQVKVIGTMSDSNRDLMQKFFVNTQFDRLSCQFAIHAFLINDVAWGNFLDNVNRFVKVGGYVILTTFDADRILDLLEGKREHTVYYTNTAGEQKILFEIVKKYEGIKKGDRIGTGVAIDFHNALDFQEGVFATEYLVQKGFLEDEFLENCSMDLVETDLFENQFRINKDYFEKAAQFEDNEKTRKFLKDAAEFYNQKSEVNRACYEMSKLYRFYVFRKSEERNEEKPKSKSGHNKNKKQKGGNMSNDSVFNDANDVMSPLKFMKRNLNMGEYSFAASVYDVLKTSEIIPTNTSLNEFYSDIGQNKLSDKEITKKDINKLCGGVIIAHNEDGVTKTVLDGINIFVIQKDCNGSDVDVYGKGNRFRVKTPSIVLYYDQGYHPIYKYKSKPDQFTNVKGLFNSKSKTINNLRNKS